MSKYLKFNNVSTILTSVFLTIFGLILGYAASKGMNLPVTADTLASIAAGIVMFIFSYFNAKYHNDIFDKDSDTLKIPADELTDEQVDLINEIISDISVGDEDDL